MNICVALAAMVNMGGSTTTSTSAGLVMMAVNVCGGPTLVTVRGTVRVFFRVPTVMLGRLRSVVSPGLAGHACPVAAVTSAAVRAVTEQRNLM